MIHDMWGTDSWPSLDATPMPGDNGSYVDFDNFLDTLFALLIEEDIVENVYWDMWNEVDNVDFLNRGLDRWLEYWGHATHKIRLSLESKSSTTGHMPTRALGMNFQMERLRVRLTVTYPTLLAPR